MRQKIVAGNWKMNGDKMMVKRLLQEMVKIQADCQKIIFPPAIYIPQTQDILADSDIAWGGQNCAIEESGAFTGEISAGMLADYGCKYVLVGHSERRVLYGDTNEKVARKFIAALQQGLIPVLCVGETQAEREQGQTKAIISEQIATVIELAEISAFEHAVIAYEPVWAIGTGLTASPEQAEEVHFQIREQIAQKDAKIAGQLPILYGGSVKPENAAELFAKQDIDGGLVGGASLDAASFAKICEAV